MLNIYELDENYFIIKNGMAVFQMVILKPSTVVLMPMGMEVPVEIIDMSKAVELSFQELKAKHMSA